MPASSLVVSDAEHEQFKEIERLRTLVARAARAAVDAQERAEGRHDAWLDDVLAELGGAENPSI